MWSFFKIDIRYPGTPGETYKQVIIGHFPKKMRIGEEEEEGGERRLIDLHGFAAGKKKCKKTCQYFTDLLTPEDATILTEDEAVMTESEEVSLIAVERESLAHQVPVGVEGLGPDGRVVPLLGHQELGEQVVLEADHGADVVAAQRVVQVEPDAVVLVEAEGGARFLRHGCGSGGGGMVRPPALAMWEEEYPRCCFWVSRYSSRDLFAVHLHSLLLSSLHACTN